MSGQAVTYAIPNSAEGMSPEGEELLTHVPSDWRQTCIETPSSDVAEAVISCFLQTEGTGVELAIFQKYPTGDAMDTQYQTTVDNFGVDLEGSCQSGRTRRRGTSMTWSAAGSCAHPRASASGSTGRTTIC